MVINIVKYGIKVVLETENQYRPATFSVDECNSPEEAEKELKQWLDKKKELMDHVVNQRIVRSVVE